MARYHKIVWTEGMFLSPHHFQQGDRYYEGILNSRLRSIAPLYWGLMDMEISQESLENGTFMLLSCHGVLPGGVCVSIPEIDETPPSRAIEEHFVPSLQTLGVYLAIPTDRPGSANYRLEDDDRTVEKRYFREFIRVVDENTGDNEQEIPIAKKTLKLLFAEESLDGHDYVKIADLERKPDGTITLVDSYVPPCITVSASQWLLSLIRRLTEVLTARSDDLRERSRERGDGFYEFGPADVSNLWLFQTINSFIPELNHFYSTGRGHPEDLFRLLAQFAGALSVFSVRVRPINLPQYDHEDLSRCFGELDAIITELLQVLTPTAGRYVPIPLTEAMTETRRPIYQAALADYLLTPSYKFYMAFKGEGNQVDLIREIPDQVKIASVNEIQFLIGKALPGIRLSYVTSPPAAIPRKSAYAYFMLDSASDFWSDVRQTKALAVQVPISLQGVDVEFMALEE